MYAVTITQPGGPEVLTWTEVPDPEPALGEVLIDVAASAVNRADLLQRQGFYPPPPGAPPYPGLECSGTISATNGDVGGWRVGDRVGALLGGGGGAQRVAGPAGHVRPLPQGVSLVDAGGLPEVACTVWSNLTAVARLGNGETVLIHGGGSGIGTFAIQYAKALGARVLTTARAVKHEKLRALGADVTIDYSTEDFAEHQADVVLDIMGASYVERNLKALRTNGRVVIIGLQGGRSGTVDRSALMAKRASITGTTLRSRPPSEKTEITTGVRREMWPLIESKLIEPVVYQRVPMSDAAEAHRIVEASEHTGKVLLVIE